MGGGPVDDLYLRRLVEAMTFGELDLKDLWLRYVVLGGTADTMEVEGYLAGLITLPDGEHNLLTEAVNERLLQIGYRAAALYRPPLIDPTPPAPPVG